MGDCGQSDTQRSRPIFSVEGRSLAFDEPCPYLPEREATLQGFLANQVDPHLYRQLMDLGFRRSGRFFYQNVCRACSECVPLRVRVDSFQPSKSQRRCVRRNTDLCLTVGTPELTVEKYDLYCRYLVEKHGDSSEKNMGAVRDFLYNPVVDSVEFCYRDRQGRLVAVGLCDVFEDALSSVYCYYEPAERRRGLGTYAALEELGYARKHALAYYYLGFHVRECPAMAYKASFRPHELLGTGCNWVLSSPADESLAVSYSDKE